MFSNHHPRLPKPRVVSVALCLAAVSILGGVATGTALHLLPIEYGWPLTVVFLAVPTGLLIAMARGRNWARWIWIILSLLVCSTQSIGFDSCFPKVSCPV